MEAKEVDGYPYSASSIRLRACQDYFQVLQAQRKLLSSRRFPFRNVQPLLDFADNLECVVKSLLRRKPREPGLFIHYAHTELDGLYLSLSLLEAVCKVLHAIPEYDEALWLQKAFSTYFQPPKALNAEILLLPEWGHLSYMYTDFIAMMLHGLAITENPDSRVPTTAHFKVAAARYVVEDKAAKLGATDSSKARDLLRQGTLDSSELCILCLYCLLQERPSLGILFLPLELSNEFYYHNVLFHELGHYLFDLLVRPELQGQFTSDWKALIEKSLNDAKNTLRGSLESNLKDWVTPHLQAAYPDFAKNSPSQFKKFCTDNAIELLEDCWKYAQVYMYEWQSELFSDLVATALTGPGYFLSVACLVAGSKQPFFNRKASSMHHPDFLRLLIIKDLIPGHTMWQELLDRYPEFYDPADKGWDAFLNYRSSPSDGQEHVVSESAFTICYHALNACYKDAYAIILNKVLPSAGLRAFSLNQDTWEKARDAIERKRTIAAVDEEQVSLPTIFTVGWLFHEMCVMRIQDKEGRMTARENLNRLIVRSMEGLEAQSQ